MRTQTPRACCGLAGVRVREGSDERECCLSRARSRVRGLSHREGIPVPVGERKRETAKKKKTWHLERGTHYAM
jgi:hypothetical protein